MSYLNWMSSAAGALNDYWKLTTSSRQLSPSLTSERHLLSSPQLIQSYHPFYDDKLTTSLSSDYTALEPMERSPGTLQLNQAILRTTLLLVDYSQCSGSDVSESEWISDGLLCYLLSTRSSYQHGTILCNN